MAKNCNTHHDTWHRESSEYMLFKSTKIFYKIHTATKSVRKFSLRNYVSVKICIGNQSKRGDSLGHLIGVVGLHSFK